MNKKIRKLLFELSKNSRITTKELGKRINASQQSSSYLIGQLKKNKVIISDAAVVDPAKLGFMNILVGYDYKGFNSSAKKEAIAALKNMSSAIRIEEATQGVDIIVEHSFTNLSAFNKAHYKFINKNYKVIETKFIYPIIVKHEYPKKYLSNGTYEDIVLCGDREIVNLTNIETRVLKVFIKNPGAKFVDIALKAKISAKTVVTLKKSLEKKRVLRGFSSILDMTQKGVERSMIFIKFSGEGINEVNKFKEYCRSNKNVVEMIKIIGDFHALVIVEGIDKTSVLRGIRTVFSIDNYLIANNSKIHRKSYINLD